MEGNALTPEQLQAIIAAAAAVRDAERREKEGSVEKAVIPRLKHNPDQQDTAIRPWPGCPYSLPRDVVELFRRGSQPPLIWLTYEGILDAGRRRQPLVFLLDNCSQEDVNDALARDALLPRTSVLSALGALAVLFRTFQDEDDVGEDEQDPATLIDELSLSISARASDEHWGLWRQYVRNVLGKIWEPRRDGDLDFDVGKIDPNLLRMTEEAASVPQGRADDHANDGKNFVTFLLTAKREDAEAAARQYEKVSQGLLPFGLRHHREPRAVMADHSRGSQDTRSVAAQASAGKSIFARHVCGPTRVMTSAFAPRHTATGSEVSLLTAGAGTARPFASAIASTSAWSASRPRKNVPLVTSAHAAVKTAAAQSPAPSSENLTAIQRAFRLPAATPLCARMFQKAIQQLPAALRPRFAHIVPSIVHGFTMGPLSLPTETIIAPDHFRADQDEIVQKWAAEAVKKGFAAGPFRLDEVVRSEGPIVTVPLTVVHTAATEAKPAKNRVCFNASWDPTGGDLGPRAVAGSINFELRDEDVQCEWFLVTEVKLLLARLPPHTRVMGFDLVDDYQHLGNRAEQRRRLTFTVADLAYVWLCGMFGVCTMAAIFGQLCDVTCAWLEFRWPSVMARHFADDHLVADADPAQALRMDEVLSEVQRFGWAVHPVKQFSWSRRFEL
ncbi:hypothetical protein V8E36_005234, partial [Tilletia maclaganii]